MSALDALSELVSRLSDKDREALDRSFKALRKIWYPSIGPQTAAYLSDADLLLYGGAAGGGKTDILLGLALTEHERSVIFRRQSVDMRGLEERLIEIVGDNNYNRSDHVYRVPGKLIELGHLERPGAELSWQGRPHDFIGFDEGAQLTAQKVNFVLGWLRSATGKRCRAVIASNPPIGGEGEWLIEWFAPWLDPAHAEYPTAFGELRWAIVMGTDDEIRTIWVDGPDPLIMDGDTYRKATKAEIEATKHPSNYMIPLSRTFIPSKLDDNPFLRDTNYRAQINAMPEPLRSQLLHGDFLAGRKDHRQQVVPTEWVLKANDRWRKARATERKLRMLHMGVDVAQGGADFTTIARLYNDASFDPCIRVPGVETPDGPSVATLILANRRNDAGITVDLGGGWGGSTRDMLKTHHDIVPYGFSPGAKSGANDKSMKLGFFNVRAEAWWKFREDLDPDSGADIKLPPDARLQAQLTTPRWELRGTKIKIEDKDDIRDRLGSSPDDADAVIMCWHHRKRSMMTQKIKEAQRNGTAETADRYDPLAPF